MARKRKRKPREDPATYIASIIGYSADYSFSVGSGHEYDFEPYSEHLVVEIKASLKISTSKKARLGTPVLVYVMSTVREVDKDFKPTCVGSLDQMKDQLKFVVLIPPGSVHYLLGILKTGKAEVIDLFGTELHHRKALIRSFRVTTAFEWEDWKDEDLQSDTSQIDS